MDILMDCFKASSQHAEWILMTSRPQVTGRRWPNRSAAAKNVRLIV